MRNLGQRVRAIRVKKGIGLNEFANKLGVSSGYLSNLETGKTETIHLSLLEKLQDELEIFPTVDLGEIDNELLYRIERVNLLLKQLAENNPELTDYLLSTVEKGIEVFNKKSSS
ncbi:transcriptional regulator [Vulcanibacillus modesticaldus]|uniref:Transcriptional regulator n=1 Tax=Vulcanibacillus modesticaldus TaxID=337097 RepID=A0A1D2YU03_9BACI|nr:helix-turn-helix transcriptional regulator [Vulcanibacillus modesticaldus]OEF99156.1 transcriptional regulator [Vulcanibacillus modesticaldus]